MSYNWDAVNAAIRAERGRRGWSQEKLAEVSGVSLGTIKNLEGQRSYKRVPVEPLRDIDRAFEQTPGTLEALLDPTSPAADTATRYRPAGTLTPERVVEAVEDVIYAVFMSGPPGTSFEDYDRARREAVKVLRSHGIEINLRNPEASSGTDTDA